MALIPPQYLNAVVSIEVERKTDKGELIKKSIATGFLVGKETGELKDDKPLYRIFLVTNRHVFFNEKTNTYLKQVFVRFNTQDKKSLSFKIDLLKADQTPLWSMHSNTNVDLAVLPINAGAINDAKVEYYFFIASDLFFAKDFKKINISIGDGVFVLGFPMGISGKARNFVIARHGIIARVDEEVLADFYFYIDASAYPGNSGGPVIHKPEMIQIGETGTNTSAGLVGVISSGETYSDIAVSQQTGEAKVIFTEQTGLVRIVPVELIYDIISMIMGSAVPVQEAKVEEAKSEETKPEK